MPFQMLKSSELKHRKHHCGKKDKLIEFIKCKNLRIESEVKSIIK